MSNESNSVLSPATELWANNYDLTREALLYIIDHNNSVPSDDNSDSALMETVEGDVAQVFIQALNSLSYENSFDEEYFVEECLKKSKVCKLGQCALSHIYEWLRNFCDPLAYRAVVARGVISGFDLNWGFLENNVALQDAAVVLALRKMMADYQEGSPFHKLVKLHFSASMTAYYAIHFLAGSNAEIVAGYPGEWTVFSDDNILAAFCLMSIACYREMLIEKSEINICVDWACNLATDATIFNQYKVTSGALPQLNSGDTMIVEGMIGVVRRLTTSFMNQRDN